MKTWVLPFRRRNGFEWTMRSRSRWNGVRTEHSSSRSMRPRVSYERTASGERACTSSPRMRAANPSATLPASSCTPTRLDDDRDGAAVGTPRSPGHVARALGEEEHDHGGDLLGLREPPERSSGAHPREHLVPVALLVGEATLVEPGAGRGRAGSDRVAADSVLG